MNIINPLAVEFIRTKLVFERVLSSFPVKNLKDLKTSIKPITAANTEQLTFGDGRVVESSTLNVIGGGSTFPSYNFQSKIQFKKFQSGNQHSHTNFVIADDNQYIQSVTGLLLDKSYKTRQL